MVRIWIDSLTFLANRKVSTGVGLSTCYYGQLFYLFIWSRPRCSPRRFTSISFRQGGDRTSRSIYTKSKSTVEYTMSSSSSALSFDRSILASTFSITLYSLFSSALHIHLPSIHSVFQVFSFLRVSFYLIFPQLPPLVNHFLVEHVQSIFFGLSNSFYQLSPFPHHC